MNIFVSIFILFFIHYYNIQFFLLNFFFLFIVFVFIGAIAELEAIWAFGDAALGFMTAPNLLTIILLSGVLKKDVKNYFSMKHIPYKELMKGKNK